MNTRDIIIILPSADEMLRRLKTVNDNSIIAVELYSRFLRYASQEKKASGIVMMLVLEITDYSNRMSPEVQNVLMISVPEFIKVLVDDESVRAEALFFYEKVRTKAATSQK